MAEEPKEVPEEESDEEPLPLKKYNELAAQDILSPFNEYVTGKFINRPPTQKDLEDNYVANHGPEAFAQKHILKARGKKEEPPDDGKIKT